MHTFLSRPILASACAALCFVVACSGPEELDGKRAAVVIFGRVTTASGDPVEGAAVRLAWRPTTTCEEEVSLVDRDTTDALGQYRGLVGGWGSRFTACVRVIADPPSNTDLLPDTALRSGVEVTSGAMSDSVEVDLVLRTPD